MIVAEVGVNGANLFICCYREGALVTTICVKGV